MNKYIKQIDFPKLFFSFVLIAFSLFLNRLASWFIYNYFPNRYVNPDILFILDNPPIYLEYISEIFLLVCGIIFFIYLLKYGFSNLHNYLNAISIAFIFRALVLLLTPMMRPTGVELPSHGFLRDIIVQTGMFPSGHIALMAIVYFFIDGKKNIVIKYLYLASFIVSAVTMVISKGHYSIDVIGGILIAYVVYNEFVKRKLL